MTAASIKDKLLKLPATFVLCVGKTVEAVASFG